MIVSNLERVLAEIGEHDRVLDVGGWAAPLNRADWVIDLMPYETRGVLPPHSFGPPPERFSEQTWVQMDICSREPWPFEDDYFDFVFCVQTLEDLRDPIGVCQEISRVGKRGYIEVPSILDELTWGVPTASGGPWCGHMHHRWLIELDGDELVFMLKPHHLHAEPRVRVPPSWARRLTLEDRAIGLFWEGEVKAREALGISSGKLTDFDALERLILDHFKPTPEERRRLAEEQRALGATPGPVPSAGLPRRVCRRLGRALSRSR